MTAPSGKPRYKMRTPVVYRRGVTDGERKTIRVVAAVVSRDGRYLITQRRETAVLPLLWEFPGGRVEPGEDDEAALVREMQERLGANVRVGTLISYVRHVYERYTVDLAAALAAAGHEVSLLAASFAAVPAGVVSVTLEDAAATR